MALKFQKNPKRKDYRLAVVVSKKVQKSAVARNRIRRRIFEIVRKDIKVLGPYDMIISVYDESTATCPSEKLQAQVVSLVQRAGIS